MRAHASERAIASLAVAACSHARPGCPPAGRGDVESVLVLYSTLHLAELLGVIQVKTGRPKIVRSGMFG